MKLTQEEYDSLPKSVQKLYTKEGDGYVLDSSQIAPDDNGGEDVDGLKSALQKERDSNKKLREDLKGLRSDFNEIKKEKEKEDHEGQKNKGDIDALEASWKNKYDKREKELQSTIEARENSLRELLVDSKAQELASELSSSPKLLMPHIKARLSAQFEDGKADTLVLDENGERSASSIEDLKKEFLSSKDFSSILIGSSGSGGGSGGPGSHGGGPSKIEDFKKEDGTTDWSKLHEASKEDPSLLEGVRKQIGMNSGSTE